MDAQQLNWIANSIWAIADDVLCDLYVRGSEEIGYEISFTRYFYKFLPLRTLDEIRADMLALEAETKGLPTEIIGGSVQ